MNNSFWESCVRSGDSAYAANLEMKGPASFSAGPCWCFQRMGQAQVTLSDGREVYIAGEHEDHYDPDFYIYNDVVVVDGDEIRIFGYPESDFPPTDFHSATVVGSRIYLIGNLGYPQDRIEHQTQVCCLDVETWEISQIETTGSQPGWIHDQSAKLTPDEAAIEISGGKISGERILENLDGFRLSLHNFEWSRLTQCQWERWILEREDGEANQLWQIRSAASSRELGISMDEQFKQIFSELPAELVDELTPNFSEDQLERIATIYQSPLSSDVALEDDDHFGRYRLEVDGVGVRIDEDMGSITVTVEGPMPRELVTRTVTQLQARLSQLESTPYRVIRVD